MTPMDPDNTRPRDPISPLPPRATLALLGVPAAMLLVGLALVLPALFRTAAPAITPSVARSDSTPTGAAAPTPPADASRAKPAGVVETGVYADAARSVAPAGSLPALPAATVLTRLAFGSCLDQRFPQPIWTAIQKSKPQLFLMLGDNVYGDIKSPDGRELVEAYRKQNAHPEFQAARAAFPMLATWDDHDYGLNDAGQTFPHRALSTALFRAFWQMPGDDMNPTGIAYARMFGREGQRVQVIMLDSRSFRSDITRKPKDDKSLPGNYRPELDPSRTMLGDAQWAWLEAELRKPAEIRMVVSSVQVLSDGHGWERWGNLPVERDRLIRLIETTAAKGVILLSGDRHMGAFYNRPLGKKQILVEATSSSLNRSYGPAKDIRTPELISDLHHVENYGVVDIDWTARRVELSLNGLGGERLESLSLRFSDLGLHE